MDFSGKHVEDGVVDSPPENKPRLPISCSPSPLRSREARTLSTARTTVEKGPQRKLYGDANYAIPEAKSQTEDESRGDCVKHPVVLLPRPRKYVLSTERYLKRKLDGPSRSHLSSATCNSWKRKSLQAERWEHNRLEVPHDKGSYSRGPEILKAMEKLRSISHKRELLILEDRMMYIRG